MDIYKSNSLKECILRGYMTSSRQEEDGEVVQLNDVCSINLSRRLGVDGNWWPSLDRSLKEVGRQGQQVAMDLAGEAPPPLAAMEEHLFILI